MTLLPDRPAGGRLRGRDELQAGYNAVLTDLAGEPDEFSRGAAAAFAWVLGLHPETPLTGAFTPDPSVEQIYHEELAADQILYRRVESSVARSFAAGVENALLWCRTLTNEPPVPLDLAPKLAS